MKKALIGALVGGLIFFFWQFLSWGSVNIHASNMQYTPQQDQILDALSKLNLEEGSYMLPNVPPGTSSADQQKMMEPNVGKPWALISYRKALTDDFGMNLFRGFIIDFLAALFLCYILMGTSKLTMQRSLTTSLMVGAIGYLTISYLNSIWFKSNSIPDLIDAVVPFALCGLWLGWWLNRD